jgi:hypothetical protein
MLIKEELIKEEKLNNKDVPTLFNKKTFQVKGIDCDIRIATISYDQLEKFLGERQHCKMKKQAMKAFFKGTVIW